MTTVVHMCSVMVFLAVSLGVTSLSASEIEIALPEPGLPKIAMTLPVASGQDTDPEVRLDYLVVRQTGRAVFEVIAQDLRLRLDISDRVNGTLSDLRLSGTRDEILDSVAGQLGVDWFAFNGALYVSDRAEALTRIVRLGDLKPETVVTTLTESGLTTDRLAIEPASDGTALALSGPPKLLALAEAMIEGIPPAPVVKPPETPVRTVKVRRGNDEEQVKLP